MKIVALIIIAALFAGGASANLIVNGSFEQQNSNIPVGWQGCDPYGGWFVLTDFGATDGVWAAYCDAVNRTQGPTWMWTTYDIPAGDYILSAWANPIVGAQPQAIYFAFDGGEDVWALSPGWNYLEKNVTVGAAGPLRVGALNYGDDGLLLDDLRLEPVPEPSGVIVLCIAVPCAMGVFRSSRIRGRR